MVRPAALFSGRPAAAVARDWLFYNPDPPPVPLVVRDNETGALAEYTGTANTGAGTVLAVNTTAVLDGTYGLQSSGTGGTNATAYAYQTITPPPIMWNWFGS